MRGHLWRLLAITLYHFEWLIAIYLQSAPSIGLTTPTADALAKATIIVKASKLQLFRSSFTILSVKGSFNYKVARIFRLFSQSLRKNERAKLVFQLGLFTPRSFVYFLYSISIRVEKRKRGGFHFFVKV